MRVLPPLISIPTPILLLTHLSLSERDGLIVDGSQTTSNKLLLKQMQRERCARRIVRISASLSDRQSFRNKFSTTQEWGWCGAADAAAAVMALGFSIWPGGEKKNSE